MLYAFTDESYSDTSYLQAAYLINESEVEALLECEKRIRKDLPRIGVSPETEFHGHAIMNARKGWQSLDGKFHLKIEVIRSLFDEIQSVGGRLIIEAIDLTIFRFSEFTNETPHQYTSRELLGRINDYAITRTASAKVFSDKISKEERARIKYSQILGSGNFQNIDSVSFVDSKDEFGIQIADLCAYISRRHVDHQERNSRTAHLVANLKAEIAVNMLVKTKKELWNL
jgi:hypothetical protein